MVLEEVGAVQLSVRLPSALTVTVRPLTELGVERAVPPPASGNLTLVGTPVAFHHRVVGPFPQLESFAPPDVKMSSF